MFTSWTDQTSARTYSPATFSRGSRARRRGRHSRIASLERLEIRTLLSVTTSPDEPDSLVDVGALGQEPATTTVAMDAQEQVADFVHGEVIVGFQGAVPSLFRAELRWR